MSLEGKTAIITGASRGIGCAIALTLADAGAAVLINYTHNREAADEVKDKIISKGGRAIVVQADVSDYSQCLTLMQSAIDNFEGIDILVNNAGITRDNLLARMKEEEWQDVIDINLTGVYNCCRAILRPLLKQKSGGKIINIASVAGIYGNSGQANYAAAKGGVIAFTKSLAKELGSRKINVNAVAPGFIETEMTSVLPEDVKKDVITRIALGRLGCPEDVAETVLFLASAADYITGQVIAVDGCIAL